MKYLILLIIAILCVDFCSSRLCCSAGRCRRCGFPMINFPGLWKPNRNFKISRNCGSVEECIRKEIITRNLIKHQQLRLHLQKLGLQSRDNRQARQGIVKPKPVTQRPFVPGINKLAGATPHQMPGK